MIVTVDGPVAAGKGTLARNLASELNLAYLDTGSIYRAVGAKILDREEDPGDPVAALLPQRCELRPDEILALETHCTAGDDPRG